MNLMDISEDLETFDYIIAHGLHSWVGPTEQGKILDICTKNLSPDGIAYVSYNTFPGWHFRGMIRDMMMYHPGHIQSPEIKAAQARALLDFLSQSVPTQDNASALC